MNKSYAILRAVTDRIEAAATKACAGYREGRILQEPAFTDRMLGYIETAMDGHEVKGVHWSAMTLTDRGPGAMEKKYGADFLGVLEINLPDYKARKGFLAQAKLFTKVDDSRAEVTRLLSQCKKMLRLSRDSYVFVYSPFDISILPAQAVVAPMTVPGMTNY